MGLRTTLGKTVGKLIGVKRTKDLAGTLEGGGARDGQLNSRYFQDTTTPQPSVLSGGTAYPAPGSDKKYIKFTASGSLVVGTTPSIVDILVVGGGGAGGSFVPASYAGGGGGGGGVRWIPSITLPVGTYPVVVGEGGTGANPPSPPYDGGTAAQPRGGGNNSIFNPGDANSVPAITATGGGGGGFGGNEGQGTGGSGGGCSYQPGGTEAAGNAGGDEPRANPVKEGGPSFPTGRGPQPSWGCCGGGGAGDVDGTSPLPRQKGVDGITLPGMGSPGDPWLPPAGNVFAGGGGGASYKSAGGLGEGGTGGGADALPEGAAAIANTGGGGGGGGQSGGGSGGDGVIYIACDPSDTVNPA